MFVQVNTATAQRITRNFQNVSMSDALKYIQQQTGNHKIVSMSRTNLFLMPFARSSVSIPSR